jgi:hypothetical protein
VDAGLSGHEFLPLTIGRCIRLGALIPHVPLVEFDFIESEELPKLILVGNAAVPPKLVANVSDNFVALRAADGEGEVAIPARVDLEDGRRVPPGGPSYWPRRLVRLISFLGGRFPAIPFGLPTSRCVTGGQNGRIRFWEDFGFSILDFGLGRMRRDRRRLVVRLTRSGFCLPELGSSSKVKLAILDFGLER